MGSITSVNRIAREEWNRHHSKKVSDDVFLIEADGSGSRGILHFSHEISLLFCIEEDRLSFLGGDEIGVEYVEYEPCDWDFLKEFYPFLTDNVVMDEIRKKY